jgi:TonB family protein
VYDRALISSVLCLAILSTAQSQEIANPTPAHAASEQTEEAQPAKSEEVPQADQAHKLPKIKTFPMQSDPYPEEGKRRHLEGRVLVEFGLDQSGKPVSVSILRAEADRVLQTGALKLMQNIRYNMSAPGFDATDPHPFRLTIKFGLPNSTRFETYPGSIELTVSGSPLPAGRRW